VLYHYHNRVHAGRMLAAMLDSYAERDDTLVLALPRGGVPVAYEITQTLDLPLDLMVVRKLGMPGQPELAMGAIGPGGVRVLNPEVARLVPDELIEHVAQREQLELDRRLHAYRGDRPLPRLEGRHVILVDDGLATGATMRASIAAARAQAPAEVVVAVPVAPSDTVHRLSQQADRVVCPLTPAPFYSIGQWYEDFSQVSDEDVIATLQRSWHELNARAYM
jgi:putative phosphoribosyl transferase